MRAPWTLAAGLAVVATGGVALALGGRGDQPRERGDADVLLERLSPGATVEQFVAQLAGVLRGADRAGDGLDAADIAFIRARDAAQARARAVDQVLPYDLSGDLIVTRREIEAAAYGSDAAARGRMADGLLARFDADGDDAITVREAAAAARSSGGTDADYLGELVALDPNGDGRLTAAELKTRAESVFAAIDRDADGTLSANEYAAIAARVQAARIARSTPGCTMPRVAAGQMLVGFGTYEGDAIASVAVGGPDRETNLIDVTIEPGRAPLYLVLTSYESMVWRLSGATGRVARVVVSSLQTASPVPSRNPRVALDMPSADTPDGAAASGVIGMSADRVTIASGSCPRYFSSLPAPEAQTAIRRSTGRSPDALFATYTAARVSLPSGTTARATGEAPVPAGFDAATWADAARYWPAGLVRVDPCAVVARVRVAPYRVLPSQMGLAQLVGSGAAVRTGSDSFRIIRPIAHMPPGMGGAHSATLVFARGVPVPPGDPVHSCIVREDTQAATGARCTLGR